MRFVLGDDVGRASNLCPPTFNETGQPESVPEGVSAKHARNIEVQVCGACQDRIDRSF
jgi:hypothetical protein